MAKISVLMPVYNTPENYLRPAIESILGQTYQDFEFVILNDASTDENVEKIVKSYTDKRIRYYKNEQNKGISYSRNRLIDLAKGEYLAVFDHDDISFPERLEKEAAFLDSHPDVGVVGSWYQASDKNKIRKFPTDDRVIKLKLMFGCAVSHTSSMIRKSVLEENGIRYEETFSPAEDYGLWVRLLRKTQFANLPEALVMYRCHRENTTHKQSYKMTLASYKIWDLVKKENPDLWGMAESLRWKKRKVMLFGIIPLIEICSDDKTDYWKLFGVLPLWSVRSKTGWKKQIF